MGPGGRGLLGAHGASRSPTATCVFSILSEHIGFSIWTMWSVLVLFMGPEYGVDPASKFFLVAVPTLVGAVLRLPYTFAVARFGGRNWTIVSATLLLIPTIAAVVVMEPGTSFWVFALVAALAGVGGGNFASSMTNINSFFPLRKKGWALGLNAGGGNIGVPVIQLVGLRSSPPPAPGTAGRCSAIYIPLIVVAAVLAALYMDNLTSVQQRHRRRAEAVRDAAHLDHVVPLHRHVRLVHRLQLRLRPGAPDPVRPHPAAGRVGHLHRAAARLADPARRRAARRPVRRRADHPVELRRDGRGHRAWSSSPRRAVAGRCSSSAFIALFVLTGLGNGSTYKMIPGIFQAKALAPGLTGEGAAAPYGRRLSGAAMGIVGAVGALGGLFINLAFRQSFLSPRAGIRRTGPSWRSTWCARRSATWCSCGRCPRRRRPARTRGWRTPGCSPGRRAPARSVPGRRGVAVRPEGGQEPVAEGAHPPDRRVRTGLQAVLPAPPAHPVQHGRSRAMMEIGTSRLGCRR